MEQLVTYHAHEGIGHIILNRPENNNALNEGALHELRAALYQLDDDNAAQVGILSGTGQSFCSGRDLDDRNSRANQNSGPDTSVRADVDGFSNRYTRWKPLIAAVHGRVAGLGLRLALMCEMMVAAKGTQFQIQDDHSNADPSRNWALLKHRSFGSFSTEVAVTGRIWTAEEGLTVRAVNRVVPRGQHVSKAEEIAKTQIMTNPPLAVRAIVEARRGVLEEIELGLPRPRINIAQHTFRDASLLADR